MPLTLEQMSKTKKLSLDEMAAAPKFEPADVSLDFAAKLTQPQTVTGPDLPGAVKMPEKPGLVSRGFKQFVNKFFVEPARTFLTEGGPGKLDSALRAAESGRLPEPTGPRRFSLGELGAAIRASNKVGIEIKKETREAAEKAVPAFEVPEAQKITEKAVDVVAGVTAFIGRLALTRKFLGVGRGDFVGSIVTWETENIATGGTPGTGAAMRLALGGIDSIPATTLAGKTLKLGAESSLFGGITAAAGGDWEDVAVSALIPLGFKAWNTAARGVAKGRAKRAIRNLRTESKRYGLDLDKVPDQALDSIINVGKQANFWNSQRAKGKVTTEVYEQRLGEIGNTVKPIFEAIGRQQPTRAPKPTTVGRALATLKARAGVGKLSPKQREVMSKRKGRIENIIKKGGIGALKKVQAEVEAGKQELAELEGEEAAAKFERIIEDIKPAEPPIPAVEPMVVEEPTEKPAVLPPEVEITPPEPSVKPEITPKPLPTKEVIAEKEIAAVEREVEKSALTGELGTLKRPDGGISTEISITVTDKRLNEGKPTNIPTLIEGQINVDDLLDGVSPTREQEEIAINRAVERVAEGQELPSYDTIEQAVKVAQARSEAKAPAPKPEAEVVVSKPSEVPKAPKEPVTETPTIPLTAKESQVFREEVRTQEKITEAEAGEVGIEPTGTSFTDHIDTFHSYQLPKSSQIPRLTKEMKRVNGLRLAGKITPAQANRRIYNLRQELLQQAIKEKVAIRVSKKGKVKIALRESGVFVPEEVATYTKYKDIEPMLGGGQDITRAIQQMDGSLTVKEKLETKGQAGPIERFVKWRSNTMNIQKLNWLKEKTIEIRDILSAKKGSVKDKEINLILEKIGTADRDTPIKDVLGKKTLASFSKESIKAAQELRQFYDDLIEEQNAARRMRGQDEIPYRQNYSPNILRDTTVWEQLFLRDKTAKVLEKKDLPDYIKPNAPFNPRAQARLADIPYDKRILSARELAESYIITASKDIFNTSIIQNNKAFIDQLRGQGLEKSAEYLAEWTATSFAGIKPRLDRAIKLPKWAEGSLRYFNRLRNLAVFPLNVAWSLSTQPLSLSNTIGRYGLPNTIRGFFQWLKPSIRKQAAQDYFSFIVKTTRRGGVTRQDASNLLGENIKTQKTTREFVENFTTVVLTEMEKLLTGMSIRAAHITGKKRGLTGEALKNFASDGGGKTQSMYNDEDKPMILRSLLVKSAAPYQTYAFEVANTFREWAGRTGTPPDSKLYAMWSLTRWVAALSVLRMVANRVRGREWDWWDLVPIPFRESLLSPIVRAMTGEFGPNARGLPAPVETGVRVGKGINDVLETGNWRKLRNETLKYLPGVPGVPGGVQIARMVDAIIVYSSGGLTDRRGRVMFEMKDPEDLARAMFTGVWTTKEGRKKLGKKTEEAEPEKFKFD